MKQTVDERVVEEEETSGRSYESKKKKQTVDETVGEDEPMGTVGEDSRRSPARCFGTGDGISDVAHAGGQCMVVRGMS